VSPVENPRGPEVGHLQNAAFGNENVGRPKIAVEDLSLVRVLA
jgi:hypothetical protein